MPSSLAADHVPAMSDIARDQMQHVRQHVGPSSAPSTGAGAEKRDPAVCPTGDEALTPRKDTRSLSYAWRSGVAGGLAGCAVSIFSLSLIPSTQVTRPTC